MPRVNAAACVEAAGAWLAVLAAGFVLLSVMLLTLQRNEVHALREARLEVTLQEIRERLEADLALGFELADSGRAQDILEETLARDGTLLAAEVFDANGASLFNTDRGSIGERVPEAWLAAAAHQKPIRGSADAPAPWSAEGADPAIGLPVRGAFGEVVGHVSLTLRPLPSPGAASFLWVVFAFLVLLAAGAWVVVARSLRVRLRAGDGGAMASAQKRLDQIQGRLERILARLTSDEGRA